MTAQTDTARYLPCRKPEGWVHVPALGFTDCGQSGELMFASNRAVVGRELDAAGIEWDSWRERTWLAPIRVFAFQDSPAARAIVDAALARLDNYPLLDERDYCEREADAHNDGLCKSECSLCEWESEQ